MPSSDDTDWILMDFNEPVAESGKVRDTNVPDTNVRDTKSTPLSRKPAKKARVKKPQAHLETVRKKPEN